MIIIAKDMVIKDIVIKDMVRMTIPMVIMGAANNQGWGKKGGYGR